MTNELATQGQELRPYTPGSKDITNDGLDMLQKQVQALEAAHRIATVLCSTGMVPQAYRGKPNDGAAAILYGAEVGLKPQQALQQVFVVHGSPAVYARTMVALLKAAGYTFQTVHTSDDSVTVRATSPHGETEEATWDIARAKKAGYTSNKKYTSDPQGMLYAKAASEVSRKIAPHILLGIKYTAEDLELEPQTVRATAERADQVPANDKRDALDQAAKAIHQSPDTDQDAAPTVGVYMDRAKKADGDQFAAIDTEARANLNDADYAKVNAALALRFNELNQQEN